MQLYIQIIISIILYYFDKNHLYFFYKSDLILNYGNYVFVFKVKRLKLSEYYIIK